MGDFVQPGEIFNVAAVALKSLTTHPHTQTKLVLSSPHRGQEQE